MTSYNYLLRSFTLSRYHLKLDGGKEEKFSNYRLLLILLFYRLILYQIEERISREVAESTSLGLK